ncbi:MAG: tRNA (N6-isopentenyl adenosine(37)-C2)-methylthiotransferase MiaB [Verrucomicrobia bacterium 21-51-4]|nr:MAG: tRNA (N6-isopentenyl adenosine(37)-C2)-methylthiotransferase MiaB [Verrucomicrobia bacterium 21-51-4]HQU08705.1 tRNA (N6-isopentenyl adenosine(37)-C2)-methylthiotransferase MiaB [Opitutales bacterium]
MNRVYIKTYGCQMNERDSQAVAAMLRTRGYTMVNDEDTADVVLLNTCSVRDQAEQKAIGKAGRIGKAKRRNRKVILGIIGCMAQGRGERLLDSLPDLDLIVGTQKFHRVPDHLDNIIASLQAQGPKPSTLIDIEEEAGSQNTIRDHAESVKQASAFVSIMQGCNMRCAFCIVPQTRGAERSRPIADIIEEVQRLVDQGTKEVTFLGQTVNRYGRSEIPFKESLSPFVQLLEAAQAIDGLERIRFTSPHPCGFKEDLVQCYGRLPKLCEYIHLPLQSGSDAILQGMNRAYTVDQYRRLVDKLRARVADMYFSTDIIVGFPGETDADFEATRQLFKEMRYDMAYVFKYSVRPATAAEPLGDPIPKDVKEARNQALLDILSESSLARNLSLVNTTQEVLITGPAKRGESMYEGHTRGYRKVIVPAQDRLVGELVPVRVLSVTESTLRGELVLQGVEAQASMA